MKKIMFNDRYGLTQAVAKGLRIDMDKPWHIALREAYAALTDKVSGKGTWESNPWVFVYDFELAD